jgi:dipeptidyl aminopeptidase/acylaminoacyl peptidase
MRHLFAATVRFAARATLALALAVPLRVAAQAGPPTRTAAATSATTTANPLPLRQSTLDRSARDLAFRVELDSTANGRWLGGGVTAPRWSPDGQWAYFQYATEVTPILVGTQPDDPWWRVSRDGRRVERVERLAALAIPTQMRHTRDASRAVWFHRGELRYWKRGARETKLLLARADALNPGWTADEREIRWVESNNLWAMDPETGTLRQLTRAHQQRDSARTDRQRAELVRQQLEIFEFARKGKVDRDSAYRRSLTERAPAPITIPFREGETISSLEVPANGKYATYVITPRVQATQVTYSDYVNDSGFVVTRNARPKVGSPVPVRRAMIVAADPMATPDSVKATAVEADTAKFGGKRVTAVRTLWNDQGTRFVVEFQSLDHKDRWLVLVDPATGKHERVLHHIHDAAWFGGAGQAQGWLNPSWFEFLPDGETLAYTSEETGWAHLYLMTMDGTARALTSGAWEIRSLSRSNDGTRWWISAGVEHPNELHLHSLPLRGGALTRVDQLGEGEIQPVLSPDEQVMAFRWGTPTELTDLYVQPVRAGATPARITRSGTDAWFRIAWPESEFISFPDDKGQPVFARVYKPLVAHANRPAVMEIHGAGYAQGVHKTFANSGAHGGALNAQYLAARGVTYVVLDYRGSAGYGRDMRTDIYRSMGDRDVKSAVAAIPVLAQRYDVNPGKVGLFGCSYGGFFTLMALFHHPGTFQGGVAQCSVTDWAHYNHGYTARILNGAPADDTTAYRVSSPIFHAEGLKDRLIIQHGLVDGNVQYQDAVRLVQRLMELGKEFDFVTYPIDAHGWQSRWARIDSQRRMMKLWEEVLLR